tara:strand:+ start:882 stop:1157 length:276 start_codon:yes stop_codon:yes gene_type:complete
LEAENNFCFDRKRSPEVGVVVAFKEVEVEEEEEEGDAFTEREREFFFSPTEVISSPPFFFFFIRFISSSTVSIRHCVSASAERTNLYCFSK